MTNTNSLSVIIPAYNEARRLPKTLEAVLHYLEQSNFMQHEVIIVDDGSSDNTSQIARALAEGHPRVRVLRGKGNHGKGWATRRGVLASRGAYVLCTDADLSTPIEETEKLYRRMVQGGYDVAIGSRKLPDSAIVQPVYRRALSAASNLLIRTVLGLPFRDTQCGFKLYRRDAALALFDRINLPRFSFDFEILTQAKKRGLRVAEVGVRWEHSAFTTVRTRDVIQSFLDVFRIRFGISERASQTQLLRFMSVGVVNTMVDAGLYVFLTRLTTVFAAELVAAKFFSFLAATISSLMLNRRWTFGVTTPLTVREVGRFYATVSISMVLNVSLMYVLVHFVGMYDLLALVVTTVCTFGLNFILSKLWVFRTERPAELVRL